MDVYRTYSEIRINFRPRDVEIFSWSVEAEYWDLFRQYRGAGPTGLGHAV